MLAAILLNLPDYQQKQGDSGGGAVAYRNNKRQRLLEAAQDIEAIAARVDEPKRLEAVRKAVKRVRKYVEAGSVDPAQVFDLSRILQMRQMELRQEVTRLGEQSRQSADFALILESFSVFVNHLQEDEDDCLVLLLSEA